MHIIAPVSVVTIAYDNQLTPHGASVALADALADPDLLDHEAFEDPANLRHIVARKGCLDAAVVR